MSSLGLPSALPWTNVVPLLSEYSTTLKIQYPGLIRGMETRLHLFFVESSTLPTSVLLLVKLMLQHICIAGKISGMLTLDGGS